MSKIRSWKIRNVKIASAKIYKSIFPVSTFHFPVSIFQFLVPSQPRRNSRGLVSIRRADNQHQAIHQRHTSAGHGETQQPAVAFWQFLRALRVVWSDGLGDPGVPLEVVGMPQFDSAPPLERTAQR